MRRTFGSALCSSSSRIGSSALTDAAQCSACQPSASSATGSAPAPSSRATTSLDDSLCWQATCRHVDPRSRWPFGSAFSASSCAALRTSLALVENKLLSLWPDGSPEASLSAGACRRQPGASASLGQSAAWSALAGLRALFHTVVRLGGFVQPLLFALRAAGKGVQHPFESCVGTGRRRARSATQTSRAVLAEQGEKQGTKNGCRCDQQADLGQADLHSCRTSPRRPWRRRPSLAFAHTTLHSVAGLGVVEAWQERLAARRRVASPRAATWSTCRPWPSPPTLLPHFTMPPLVTPNFPLTASLDDRLRRRESRVKALACTPGVCATDMFAHVQTLSNPNAVVDLAAVPSPEDGSLAQVSKSVRR